MEIDPLYGQVFEVCPLPIVITDEEGNIAKANRATNALFRIASPLAGRKLDELIPDWPRMPEGKLHFAIGRVLRLSDALSIPVDIAMFSLKNGTSRYLVFTLLDQSEKQTLFHDLHTMTGNVIKGDREQTA